jgi:hypothetical protein
MLRTSGASHTGTIPFTIMEFCIVINLEKYKTVNTCKFIFWVIKIKTLRIIWGCHDNTEVIAIWSMGDELWCVVNRSTWLLRLELCFSLYPSVFHLFQTSTPHTQTGRQNYIKVGVNAIVMTTNVLLSNALTWQSVHLREGNHGVITACRSMKLCIVIDISEGKSYKQQTNSVALVRIRTIPTERPPLSVK